MINSENVNDERKLFEKYKPIIRSFKSLNEAEEWLQKEAN